MPVPALEDLPVAKAPRLEDLPVAKAPKLEDLPIAGAVQPSSSAPEVAAPQPTFPVPGPAVGGGGVVAGVQPVAAAETESDPEYQAFAAEMRRRGLDFPDVVPPVTQENLNRTGVEGAIWREDQRRAAAGEESALARGSAGYTEEYKRGQAEMPGAIKRGVLQGASNLGTVIEAAIGDSDPERVARRQAQINEMAPAPSTGEAQFVEGFAQETTEAAPLLVAAAPLQIPGRIGQLVTQAVKRIPGGAKVAPAVGGVTGMATGAAEFGAAAQLPEAVEAGSVAPVAQGAAHPFTAAASITAKLATGQWDEITIDEWINAAFLGLGGYRGARSAQRVTQEQPQPTTNTKTGISPDIAAILDDASPEKLATLLRRAERSDRPGSQALADAIRARMEGKPPVQESPRAQPAPAPQEAPPTSPVVADRAQGAPSAPGPVARQAPQTAPAQKAPVAAPAAQTPAQGNVAQMDPRGLSPAQEAASRRDVAREEAGMRAVEQSGMTVEPPPGFVRDAQEPANAQPAQTPARPVESPAAEVQAFRAEQEAGQLKPGTGARRSTAEGAARLEAAKAVMREAVNNPDLVGKQRVDTISNLKQLVGFHQAMANQALETDYFKGNEIAYTGVTTDDGFREFIYLEGAQAGAYGQRMQESERQAMAEKRKRDEQSMQEGFRKLADKPQPATVRESQTVESSGKAGEVPATVAESATVQPSTERKPDARKDREAAPVHGPVREQAKQGKEAVPAQEGRAGVQQEAEGVKGKKKNVPQIITESHADYRARLEKMKWWELEQMGGRGEFPDERLSKARYAKELQKIEQRAIIFSEIINQRRSELADRSRASELSRGEEVLPLGFKEGQVSAGKMPSKYTLPEPEKVRRSNIKSPKEREGTLEQLGGEEARLRERAKLPPDRTTEVISMERTEAGNDEYMRGVHAAREAYPSRGSSAVDDLLGGIKNFKEFIRKVPEFRIDPTFTVTSVEDGMRLRFKDGGTYTFEPKGIGVALSSDVQVGDRIRFDPDVVMGIKNGIITTKASPQSPTFSSAPKPGRLAGGGEAGAAAGVQATGETIAATVHNATHRIARGSAGALKGAKRFFRRATNWLDSMGGAGKTLAREIRQIDRRAAKVENNATLDAQKALSGLNRKQREMVAKSINSRESVADAPAWVKQRAKNLRGILDRGMEEIQRINAQFAKEGKPQVMRRDAKGNKFPIKGSGKAFPQVPNAEGRAFLDAAVEHGLADARVQFVAEQMVNKGRAKTVDDALAMIRDFQESRMRGVNRYFERTRFELPEEYVEWDPQKVLPDLFHRNAMFVEGVREWGADLDRAKALSELIGKEQKDPAVSSIIDDYIGHHFGKGGIVPRDTRAAAGLISNYLTLSKLGFSLFSVLRNVGQRFGNLAYMPLSANIKATVKYPPLINRFIASSRKLQEEMQRTGAVRSHSSLADVEARTPGEGITSFALGPFQSAERGNQTYAALVAKLGIERDLAMLAKIDKSGRAANLVRTIMSLGQDTPAALRRRLESMSISDEKITQAITSGKMDAETVEAAMVKVVLDTQFPLTIATERVWWPTSPWIRVFAKFKTFMFDQTGFIWNRVVKEATKGNLRPLAATTLAMIVIGELYNIARDEVTGADESIMSLVKGGGKVTAKKVAARMLANIIDGGGLGILADAGYGIVNLTVGPVGGTVENVLRSGADTIRRPDQWWDALRDFGRREIAITKQIDGAVTRAERAFGRENSRFIDYAKWRKRSFEFKDETKKESWLQDYLLGVTEGFGQAFSRTDRSLGYEYAARQITAGDVDDAADYLRRILESAKDEEERASYLDGIRDSMRSKSPLGAVKKDDLDEFLSTFDKDEQEAAENLQDAWIEDYERAIDMADEAAK